MADLLPNWTDLSLKEKIGQTIVVRASGYLFDRQIRYPTWEPPATKLKYWLQELNLGGVIVLGGSAPELLFRTQQLQSWSKIPLLIAADIEEGVGHRFAGATWFPPPMALGEIAAKNPSLARECAVQMGVVTASEALAVGINWILAPVVDVNNNPDNPVINVRSFGDTPEVVGNLAAAFISGADRYPVLTTAKHFPGHGDTAEDSHILLPVLSHSASRLAEVELPPFEKAIAAGVDSVMSAHLIIPDWDGDRPATISKPILTGKLREQLGFSGLIVTDALIMAGAAKYATPEEIAVMAVEAGADILLMPQDPEVAIAAIEGAVRSGRLSDERINASVERIWKAKQKVFQFPEESKTINYALQSLSQLDRAIAIQTADVISQKSMKIGGCLPIESPPSGGKNLILVDEALNCSDFLAWHTPAVAIPEKLGCETQLVDAKTLTLLNPEELSITLLQIFIRGNPFRGSASLTPAAKNWLELLLKKNSSLCGLAIYGSPYVQEWLTEKITLPWVFSYGQMPAAQKSACELLFGLSSQIEIRSENFL